MAVAVVQLRC